MKTTAPRQVEKGHVFKDVEEYFAWRGLQDGYYDIHKNKMDFVRSRPFPDNPRTHQICMIYLLGFELGREIVRSYEEDKETTETPADGGDSIGARDSSPEDDSSRTSVVGHIRSDTLVSDGACS